MVSNADMMQISSAWIRIINKMMAFEKNPRDFGSGNLLSNSEIHMIMVIGKNPGLNVTSLSLELGITKSAVSQMIRKLVQKKLVDRTQLPDNDKEIRLSLTPRGKIAFLGHETHHAVIFARMHEKLGDMTEDQFTYLMKFFSAIEATTDELA
ncbi:MAG: MarR family transcriptional regulator [Methanomicrobiales archaeon]|nr:MarR family transcriptional regulator [Methanomicrobiales archaeon]